MALTTLIVQQLRSKSPIVDLRLFKDRTYAVGVFLMTVLGFVLYGSLVLLPVMLQTLLGYSSYQAGQAMVPRGIGSMMMMPVVGLLTGMVDPRRLLILGLAIGGGTLIWMGQLNLQAGYWDIFWPQFLQGAGLALLFVPLTTVSMATISQQRMGYATSLFNLMRNIGGSVGIAITATILQRQRQATGAQLGEHLSIYDPTTQSTLAQLTSGIHCGRRRRRDRLRTRADDSAGHAPARSVDGVVRDAVPAAGRDVPAADPARVHHAPAQGRLERRRRALEQFWRLPRTDNR